jgi:uncharacterized membrane protein
MVSKTHPTLFAVLFSPIGLFVLAFPRSAYAFEAIQNIVGKIVSNIINPLIGMLFAVGFAVFLWGIARYVFNSGNDTERDTGRKHILWGLIGMLIMVGVAGIINIIRGTIGV